jgi:hypothetical protein
MIGSRAFTGLGRGGRATLSALAFGLIFVSLVALARPAGALYRVNLNPATDSTALPAASAGEVPAEVLRDARQLAREVYRNQEQAEAYTEQLLALYQATLGQQALLVFSPGGWGTKSVEHSAGWDSIVRGLDEVLRPTGLDWMVLNYRRTPHKWYAKIDEAFAQLRKYPRKAPDLARRLDFLTAHHPGLTVFLASESNGTMFNDRVMLMLNNQERVYNIATGPPFYYTMRHLEHTLVLNDNGEVPDAFSQGHVGTILRSNFTALFRLDGQDRPRGDVMGRIRAPGHYYGWDRPKVAADITGFVTGILTP